MLVYLVVGVGYVEVGWLCDIAAVKLEVSFLGLTLKMVQILCGMMLVRLPAVDNYKEWFKLHVCRRVNRQRQAPEHIVMGSQRMRKADVAVFAQVKAFNVKFGAKFSAVWPLPIQQGIKKLLLYFMCLMISLNQKDCFPLYPNLWKALLRREGTGRNDKVAQVQLQA